MPKDMPFIPSSPQDYDYDVLLENTPLSAHCYAALCCSLGPTACAPWPAISQMDHYPDIALGTARVLHKRILLLNP
jgi:hypothetical protein